MEIGKFLDLLKGLAESLPSLIAMIACIGFAITRRRRYPKVSRMVIISLVLLIFHVFFFAVVYEWVPGWFIQNDGYDAIRSRNVFLVLGLVSNIFLALFTAILVAAVFVNRNRDSRPA